MAWSIGYEHDGVYLRVSSMWGVTIDLPLSNESTINAVRNRDQKLFDVLNQVLDEIEEIMTVNDFDDGYPMRPLSKDEFAEYEEKMMVILKSKHADEHSKLCAEKELQWIKEQLEILQQREKTNAQKRKPILSLRKRIIERDQSICRYCGEHATDKMHIDHVIPYSLGGRTEIENLVVACDKCNLKKSGRTLEEASMRLL